MILPSWDLGVSVCVCVCVCERVSVGLMIPWFSYRQQRESSSNSLCSWKFPPLNVSCVFNVYLIREKLLIFIYVYSFFPLLFPFHSLSLLSLQKSTSITFNAGVHCSSEVSDSCEANCLLADDQRNAGFQECIRNSN